MVPEVLPKGVPVSPLLVLIAAESGGGGGGGGDGGRRGGACVGGSEGECDYWVCCGTVEILNRVHVFNFLGSVNQGTFLITMLNRKRWCFFT